MTLVVGLLHCIDVLGRNPGPLTEDMCWSVGVVDYRVQFETTRAGHGENETNRG